MNQQEKQQQLENFRAIRKQREEDKNKLDLAFRGSKYFKTTFVIRITYLVLATLLVCVHYIETGFHYEKTLESKAQCYESKRGDKQTDFFVKSDQNSYHFGLMDCRPNYFVIGNKLKVTENWCGKALWIQDETNGPMVKINYSFIGHTIFVFFVLISFAFRYGHEKISRIAVFVASLTSLISLLIYFIV